MAKFSLTDLIPLKTLQHLQDSFAVSNGVASTITDSNGEPITRPSNYCKVCILIRETKKGFEKCKFSGKVLGLNSLNQNKPYYHHCKSVGFIDAAAPIVIEGDHIANWLIGQTCTGGVDEQQIRSFADEIGADQNQLFEAFQGMTVVSEEEFKEKIGFLWIMASQLSTLAFHNLRYKETVKVLEQRERELNTYKDQLEVLVEQRTAELQTALEEVRLASMKDTLTGSYNRAFINDSLPREIRRAQRYNNPVSVILCDIDHFKSINDTYGHQAGDHILLQVAACLQNGVRNDVDWVARYGGEEFLIALPVSNGIDAQKAGERLRKSLEQLAITYNGELISVRASFGVSTVVDWKLHSGITPETLIASADKLLYSAKHMGRNCVVAGVVESIL